MQIYQTEGMQGKTELGSTLVARASSGACPQLTCRGLPGAGPSAVTCIRPLPRGRGHAAAEAPWRERERGPPRRGT